MVLRLLKGHARPLAMMALRVGTMVAKFLLALYTARYLGLADLGVYGLVTGAATMAPWLLGFGVTDWTLRQIATMARPDAAACVATRLAFTLALHAVGQPLGWIVNAALGAPVPWPIAFAAGAILLLEHLACDANDMLLARRRALMGTVLLFVRSGLWPFAVIAWGLLDPAARTLECMLLGWIGGLALAWLAILGHVAAEGRWRFIALRPDWLLSGIRASVPLYVRDLAGALNLYLDRFLISLFLGLELTGVYTLFWSIGNVVHNLAVASLVQPQLPAMIDSAARGPDAFRALERRLRIEVAGWAAALIAAAAFAMPVLLPHLGRPLLEENLPVLWLMLAATVLRMGADSYGYALLALHRDTAIAIVGVVGVIMSAVLNLVLVPTLGLDGAALAFLVTSGALFAIRFWIARAWPENGLPAAARS